MDRRHAAQTPEKPRRPGVLPLCLDIATTIRKQLDARRIKERRTLRMVVEETLLKGFKVKG